MHSNLSRSVASIYKAPSWLQAKMGCDTRLAELRILLLHSFLLLLLLLSILFLLLLLPYSLPLLLPRYLPSLPRGNGFAVWKSLLALSRSGRSRSRSRNKRKRICFSALDLSASEGMRRGGRREVRPGWPSGVSWPGVSWRTSRFPWKGFKVRIIDVFTSEGGIEMLSFTQK